MYMVISQWEVLPGHEQQMRDSGETMRSFLRTQPGVELVESFKADDGNIYVVHGYTDEATYNRVINDPNGAFARKLQEEGTETHARWVKSMKGETIDAGTFASRVGRAAMR